MSTQATSCCVLLQPANCACRLIACAVFLSVFKWEARKGWKDLVRGFCDAFKPSDNAVLWILTKPFLDSGEVRRGWLKGSLC